MTFTVETDPPVVVVALEGPFEGGADGAQLYDACRVHCAEGRSRLVIDCAGLRRLTAQGLGQLAGLLVLARNAGGECVLARTPDFVESLLLISGLEEVFPAYDSVAAARRAVTETKTR
jgi:anti-anti-sigma factor